MTLSLQRLYKLLIVLGLVLSIDVLTKYLTHNHIPLMHWASFEYPYGGIPVFKDILGVDLSINHVVNRGGPWGVVSDYHGFLLVTRVIAVACLCVHLLFFNQVEFRQIPLTMIIAGAIGNIVDSFFYGHVIDMIHFVFGSYSFPVFNVADSSICIGIALIMGQALYLKVLEKKSGQSFS